MMETVEITLTLDAVPVSIGGTALTGRATITVSVDRQTLGALIAGSPQPVPLAVDELASSAQKLVHPVELENASNLGLSSSPLKWGAKREVSGNSAATFH